MLTKNEMDEKAREKLERVEFFVEATSDEQFFLWQKYNRRYKWEQDLCGLSYTIEYVAVNKEKLPIHLGFSFAKLNGHHICFYSATSLVVHHGLIEKFLDTEFPVKFPNGERNARTDAGNFHRCLGFCTEGLVKQKDNDWAKQLQKEFKHLIPHANHMSQLVNYIRKNFKDIEGEVLE